MKKMIALFILMLTLLSVSGCAASPNALENTADEGGEVAGFWQGLWHGFISPITFIISLFSDSLNIYEVYNNGGWYNFGFLLGASIVLGGSGGGVSRRRRR